MASLDSVRAGGLFSGDSWVWWQARRLRYNLVLAAGGWIAYAAAIGLNYAFGHPVWKDWRGGLGMTLFLGTAFLVVMGIANVAYLLGPAVEGWARPADVDHYRRNAYAMGLWGSFAVPFVFPLVQLAMLIANS
ncbi:hypothetical protein [Phenylobacterium sp.]|jgi:hypothetical protein|uniref:hypothetical protein n=1 Tax=Phenylobacterium sp. TaxID=1871053 RepID=UPI002E336A37|nr:hypothetical protein [Phenylobacterium sp.]HEX3365194.1 hypothetical protein [Phenylobacterium sp.]